MFRTLTLVSLLNLVLPAFSSPCAVFDASFNLYVLGLGGKDWNAGTQDTWTSGTLLWHDCIDFANTFISGSATDVTTSGRP